MVQSAVIPGKIRQLTLTGIMLQNSCTFDLNSIKRNFIHETIFKSFSLSDPDP